MFFGSFLHLTKFIIKYKEFIDCPHFNGVCRLVALFAFMQCPQTQMFIQIC